jgi:protocatechuate 3,4-dioxygenase beta subunit
MNKIGVGFLLIFYVTACTPLTAQKEKQVGGGCEECDLMFEGMPSALSWQTSLTDAKEPGELMIISGTIFKSDGKTPAPNVVLYVYQTDNMGLYSKALGQTQAIRHGRIRGWMKTDDQGRYEFKTIRPASYPDSKNPQHIHPIIKEPGLSLYWIDEYLFEDDPLLTKEEKTRAPNHGGSGIIKPIKNSNGVWVGKRDIILGKNIPNY